MIGLSQTRGSLDHYFGGLRLDRGTNRSQRAYVRDSGTLPDWQHLRVSLDHFSHQSGNRRAFSYCNLHDNCRLYVFIRDFDGNKEKAAAYLFAWRMNGTRWKARDAAKLHIDTKPEASIVDKVHKQCFL